MNLAEYILGLSGGLGMVVAWIHSDRALVGKTLTVRLKAEKKNWNKIVLILEISQILARQWYLLVLGSLTNAL